MISVFQYKLHLIFDPFSRSIAPSVPMIHFTFRGECPPFFPFVSSEQSCFFDKLYMEYSGSPVTSLTVVRKGGSRFRTSSREQVVKHSRMTSPAHLLIFKCQSMDEVKTINILCSQRLLVGVHLEIHIVPEETSSSTS